MGVTIYHESKTKSITATWGQKVDKVSLLAKFSPLILLFPIIVFLRSRIVRPLSGQTGIKDY